MARQYIAETRKRRSIHTQQGMERKVSGRILRARREVRCAGPVHVELQAGVVVRETNTTLHVVSRLSAVSRDTAGEQIHFWQSCAGQTPVGKLPGVREVAAE